MAHNIEEVNGVYSFVENGRQERAWHNLGQVFDGPMTVAEALELSHANYQVSLQPVFMYTPAMIEAIERGETITSDMLIDGAISGRKATMRTDTNQYLGMVSPSYGIVQNEDAFKFIDMLVTGQVSDRGNTPVIETAGVLGHGERVFVTAKFPEAIRLDNKGDDLVEMNVVFTTSHNGEGAVNVLVTPVRVVCNNTLNYAMGCNRGKLSLKHTSGIMSRLDLANEENAEFAYQTLNIYNIYKKSLEENFNHLRNIKISEKKLNDILAEVILSESNYGHYKKQGIEADKISTRGKNVLDKVKETIHCGVGQDMGEKGTGLWLINGLTSFYQNVETYKSEERKMDSILNGYAKDKLQKAYNLVCEVA